MKKIFILVLSLLTTLTFVDNTYATESIDSIASVISENMDLFNLPVEGGKEHTNFQSTQHIVPVYDLNKVKAGTLITFDDNDGYFIMYSNDNTILEYDYTQGFPVDLSNHLNGIVKDNDGYYDLQGKLIYSIEMPLYGGGVNFY